MAVLAIGLRGSGVEDALPAGPQVIAVVPVGGGYGQLVAVEVDPEGGGGGMQMMAVVW